jgi:hypothetical protein
LRTNDRQCFARKHGPVANTRPDPRVPPEPDRQFGADFQSAVTEDDKAETIVATLDESLVVAMMLRLGIPLTRENYIRMNYWENKELR